MTEQEWMNSTDPVTMMEELRFRNQRFDTKGGEHRKVSDRKLRLWAAASIGPSGCSVYNKDKVEKAHLDELVRHMLICCHEPRKAQVDAAKAVIFRDIVGNPFRPVKLKMLFYSRDIFQRCLDIARTIYKECRFDELPILADALEEAGCESQPKSCGKETNSVLVHLRSPGPHVRGCWVLDLVLEKD